MISLALVTSDPQHIALHAPPAHCQHHAADFIYWAIVHYTGRVDGKAPPCLEAAP